MKIKLFYHSLISCWNHRDAHFLRGIMAELQSRGHKVEIFEPSDGRSYSSLVEQYGGGALSNFKKKFPELSTNFYFSSEVAYEKLVSDADVVIVHESNSSELVNKIGRLKEAFGYKLLFHDTHHRTVSAPVEMEGYDLSSYDGVLASGKTIKDIYQAKAWARQAWTWHEAADTRVFYPKAAEKKAGDVVWIGNWGNDEREEELDEFFIKPVKELELKASIYGVGYPERTLKKLADAGIEYKGWLPNYRVPDIFSQYKFTVHIPRRPFRDLLPGIPGIRPFEAMACGIPLLSAPWSDTEGLFEDGKDFRMVENGKKMKEAMQELLENPHKARNFATNGLNTIREKHTCAKRVNELLEIVEDLQQVTAVV